MEELRNRVNDLEETIRDLTRILQPCIGRNLLAAVRSEDLNTVRILCRYENDTCTTVDPVGDTPLTIAAAAGNLEMVQVLLESGVEIGRGDKIQSTALHKAAWNGHVDVCRALLDGNANVNAVNSGRYTPLHCAAEGNKLSVVQLLVERGANLKLENGAGLIAEGLARKREYTDVADYLKGERRNRE